MITREQALRCQEFHTNKCALVVGPRGGETVQQQRVRRNGNTQTWKTRPTEWSLPVKYGLKQAFRITQRDADLWHAAEDCPLNHTRPQEGNQ